MSTLVPSERLLSHVSNDGLALVLGRSDLGHGGTFYEQIQLAIVVRDLLALVVEAATDCDGCACQLIDLGYSLAMRDLQGNPRFDFLPNIPDCIHNALCGVTLGHGNYCTVLYCTVLLM